LADRRKRVVEQIRHHSTARDHREYESILLTNRTGRGKIPGVAQTQQTGGLRERNKTRTREAIRRAAMQLIESNGYASTTVEQIAEAAEVSASTFFRYFSSKQSVLMTDVIDRFAVSALAAQPAGISTMQALRQTLQITQSALSEDEWRVERRRRQLVLSIPEIREMQHEEHRRTAATMTQVECRRLGREPDDFEVRVFFGALVGAMLTALSGADDVTGQLFRALQFVEAGMPLSTSVNPA
jgi:AcrR family transcriptional regulator